MLNDSVHSSVPPIANIVCGIFSSVSCSPSQTELVKSSLMDGVQECRCGPRGGRGHGRGQSHGCSNSPTRGRLSASYAKCAITYCEVPMHVIDAPTDRDTVEPCVHCIWEFFWRQQPLHVVHSHPTASTTFLECKRDRNLFGNGAR